MSHTVEGHVHLDRPTGRGTRPSNNHFES